jgi:hypothetical protein
MSKRQGSRSKQGKMKSLWEELAVRSASKPIDSSSSSSSSSSSTENYDCNRKCADLDGSLVVLLQDIGEEFVEFLEKELNIDEGDGDKKQGADFAKQQRQSPKGAYDSSKASRQDAPDDKRKVETETAEIDDMLAKLKKELGI